MNIYKLIALDMDGTLLRSDKTVHPNTIRDIAAASSKGCVVVYCTGRGVVELGDYFENLPMMRYAICNSGAVIYDCQEDKCIYHKEISREDVLEIVRVSLNSHAMVHFLTDRESIVCSADVTHMQDFHMEVYAPMYFQIAKQVESMKKEAEKHVSIAKVNIYFRSEEDRLKGYEALKHLPLSFAFAEKTSLEMTACGVSKGTGIEKLAEYLKIPMEQTVGIGDSDNDKEMLSRVAFPIAMGNARACIQKQCNYITADNDHNGVGEALQYLGLCN